MAGAPAEAHAFEYDGGAGGAPYAKGRLTKVTDPAATTRWQFTAEGRVAAKSQEAGGVTLVTSYEYNAAGQPIRMQTPSGQTVAYDYRNNRIASIAINGVAVISSVAAEPFGPAATWQWGNGLVTYRDHDADGRISGWELRNGAIILRNDLAWDAANRITRIADPINPARTTFYQYDALDRLTLVQRGDPVAATQQFGYDAVGNRTSINIDGALASLTHGAASNRLLEISSDVANDPLRGELGRTYTYNLANRLVRVASDAGGVTDYEVSALGQRLAKSVGGVVTRYVYDEGGRLLGEYDGAGRLVQETIWLDDLPVATLRPKSGSTTIPVQIEIFYVHADHLGSPRAVTRPADNALMWRWDNADPFGANAASDNPAGNGTFVYNLRFPGQYYDAETGTHYNYFRDYDPTIGRYLQSDPIGLIGGINTFVYAKSNPLVTTDQFGLKGCGSGPTEGTTPNLWFGSCCDTHDDCYDDCKNRPTKQECDNAFCSCVHNKCTGWANSAACHILATGYCRAVKASETAQEAFDRSRTNCDGPQSCAPSQSFNG
jgi:RHS repeat-associated protein